MKTLFTCLLLLCTLTIAIAQSEPQPQKVSKKDVKQLVKLMTGTFSNELQAQKDTNFFHIRLVMKPIWTDRKYGYWLYVEQASAKKLNKPYRQRVYHVHIQDKYTIASEVFEIASPLRFAGEWEKANPLSALNADSLTVKEGCAVLLKKYGSNYFQGKTASKDCKSVLSGASYATSEVTITAKGVYSLDQGFDSNNKQVWGSTFGAYRFLKALPIE